MLALLCARPPSPPAPNNANGGLNFGCQHHHATDVANVRASVTNGSQGNIRCEDGVQIYDPIEPWLKLAPYYVLAS